MTRNMIFRNSYQLITDFSFCLVYYCNLDVLNIEQLNACAVQFSMIIERFFRLQ